MFGAASPHPPHAPHVRAPVDGGASTAPIGIAAEAGADTFVAGSAVYGGVPAERIAELRAAVAVHTH